MRPAFISDTRSTTLVNHHYGLSCNVPIDSYQNQTKPPIMKYSLSNTINRPLEEVIAKFKEEEGAKHWMEGLQRIERISGSRHEVGSKSKFHFLHRKKEMIIDETILESNLPDQIKFGFQSSMGYNEVEMKFEELSDKSVKQINNTYFELRGFMKLLGPLMKGMFKKQSMKYMTAFKAYVEQ